MIINDLDGYYIVFDTKNWNTELDTLINKPISLFLIYSLIVHATVLLSHFAQNDENYQLQLLPFSFSK